MPEILSNNSYLSIKHITYSHKRKMTSTAVAVGGRGIQGLDTSLYFFDFHKPKPLI